MVGLTLIIGIVNLGLGYALAVWLGYGSLPPTLAGWTRGWPARRPVPNRPAPAVPPAPVAAEKPPGPAAQTPSAEVAQPEPFTLDETFVEASVLRLNLAMLRSGAKVTEIDSRLRASRGNYDRPSIEQCLAELLADCETYLVEQSEAAERFHQRIGELGELNSLAEQIELANLEQSAQVETTISNLRNMDFESDLAAAAERLLTEIDGLRAARHRLRDSQEIAFVDIARHQGRLAAIDERLKTDTLSGMPNRIALEATLAQWWQEGRPKSHTLSAALLDLDAFGQLNKTYGSSLADRILRHVAQYLLGAAGQGHLTGRYAGQRFLLVAEDVGPRALVKHVELMRQSIERMTFKTGAETIRLTASAAIAEVPPDDAPQEFLERLEQMLAEARAAGVNQSLLWDQDRSQRVDSPNFGAEYREIAL